MSNHVNDNGRKIIHIDMDAFYASVEQRDFPELRGKAIAVGGSRDRGVVCTASYEARKFGVRSAMSSKKARQLCPDLIFTPVRFSAYREASAQIREIFLSYTDLVEPLSLDEAYLDVTENKKGMISATEIANQIRQDIFDKTQLTASAGISFNKFLAKTASDIQKPNGYTVIIPKHAQRFLDGLAIEKFHGIGKVTAQKMHHYGIKNGQHLRNQSQEFLAQNFGKSGLFYYNIVRGNDLRKVNPTRIRKSISAENTFSNDVSLLSEIELQINNVTEMLFERIEKANLLGLTITLKIKYNDFTIASKGITNSDPLKSCADYKKLALNLYQSLSETQKPIRLIGLKLSNFVSDSDQKQYSLF